MFSLNQIDGESIFYQIDQSGKVSDVGKLRKSLFEEPFLIFFLFVSPRAKNLWSEALGTQIKTI